MEERSKHNKTCLRCGTNYVWFEKEAWWQDYGTYSVKLTKCPHCQCINSLKHEDASGLYVNTDKRYY